MKIIGFYIIKDKFFEDMTDLYLKGNKAREIVNLFRQRKFFSGRV